jgi:uncharacterized protein with HEPN domain
VSRKRFRLDTFLGRMLDASGRIEHATRGLSFPEFERDQIRQDAVLMNLIRLGEACHMLQKHFWRFTDQHPEIPFEEFRRLRNRLSHDYANVQMDLVWRTVMQELPEIRQAVLRARAPQ